jgi:hypothetical protein
MVSNKVLIGVATGEYARRADFYDYYHMLIKPENSGLILGHDRSPAHNRNLIIQAAIDNEFTHVLLIDDDMAYKPEALVQLLRHDVDIVSGLYLRGSYPHPPNVFDLADEDGAAFPMYLTPDKQGLVPIVAAGFGFLLVKIEVFKKLEKPYVRLGELNPEEWCDDIGFFKRVREAGIQSYCDLDVQIGHMRTMIIWPNKDKNGDWMTGYDTNGTGAINTPQITPIPKYEFKEK